jgi:hypothetical protein
MLSAHYIVGLTDGEGSFNIVLRVRPAKSKPINYKVECHYYLKLVEDDLPLLKKVKESFGCGAIYTARDKRARHRNCYRFEISNLKDITEKVIPLFKKYPLQSVKRKRDFDLFCIIVGKVKTKQHLTERGWKEIEQLKGRMHI